MDKSFKCTQCSRSFTRVENLNRHRRTHNEVLPYRCDLCQRGFSRSDLFKKHRLLHDRDQSAQPASSTGEADDHHKHESSRKRVKHNDATEEPSRSSPADPQIPSRRHNSTIHGQADTSSSDARYQIGVVHPPPFAVQEAPLISHGQRDPGLPSNAASYEQHSLHPLINPHIIDHSAFSLPWDDIGSGNHEWFTMDFYEALRETDQPARPEDFLGKDLGFPLRPAYDGWLPPYEPSDIPARSEVPSMTADQNPQTPTSNLKQQTVRAMSPPNLPSNEDALPFAYDPSSSTIRQGGHIAIDEADSLLLNHDKRFDISQSTWSGLRRFLAPPTTDHKDDFTLPSLRVANAFIGLFFRCFAAQAPILHLSTVDMNSLPPPLLASIMAIGATYSNRRHTRSFAILVLDRARRNVQTAIENDNRITRDVHVIYAIALKCYFCLWCGNKRAYEIGESLRGISVTFVRRLLLSEQDMPQSLPTQDLESQWASWIAAESRRRLLWFVFMIDGTFPALLNIPSMMSLAEITRWKCPCDEEFWVAPTAKTWKSLLGPASIPPAPTFAMASGTYLSICLGCRFSTSSSYSPIPSLRLNDWSIFLVVVALSSRSMQWSQNWHLVLSIMLETNEEKQVLAILESDYGSGAQGLIEERLHITDALDQWRDAFLRENIPAKHNPTDAHFQEASILLHSLSRMLLNFSLTTIQSMLGKDGANGVETANRLAAIEFSERYIHLLSSRSSARHARPDALSTVNEALNTTILIMNNPAIQSASPYSILTAFLSHVILWAFTKTSDAELKGRFARQMYRSPLSSKAAERLRSVLSSALSDGPSATRPHTNLILKHAAQQLTEMGTWGCSLNLALLLHKRAELEQ